MNSKVFAFVLLFAVGINSEAVDMDALQEALSEALYNQDVNVEQVQPVKRDIEVEARDEDPLRTVVKRSAGADPLEFVAYGGDIDEAKTNALKMAQEMYGEDFRVRFR